MTVDIAPNSNSLLHRNVGNSLYCNFSAAVTPGVVMDGDLRSLRAQLMDRDFILHFYVGSFLIS